ncbi:phospholipid carrier-dependent glycosyltransferase [Altererythrobacter luteolus]|uniref:Polyprenol-phosphate-mannose--protein mannosyltransferase n=1 Tax=Pontixanthobacter luteolus TaxID=295089 RepID=A0A6I4UXC1_9SPHN|nr:glycosyltransferase family 39 protein [Pontixanthobacter luteolus]MXP46223.1 phospholipid carrier-dependent glycosyltransferase [Pontixanthobacter luteolus]
MNHRHVPDSDPVGWIALLCLGFFLLGLVRLTVPSIPYFDEVHYLPAARGWLESGAWLNREHPPLGKQIIAVSIAVFGDNPTGWRLPSLIFGTLTLYSAMRALWFASFSRFASIAYGILFATGFALFVHSRIAMLDIFMVGFFAFALWQCVAAMREPETGRKRLAAAGVALGLAMASKWNVVILAMIPGLAFLALRASAGRRRLLTSQRGLPVPGISLLEAAVWLGAVPLTVYSATYLPAFFAPEQPLEPGGFIALHRTILEMQSSVVTPHPYQSNWMDWMLNKRAIWYLYEAVDGAQRGVLLIGNPLTMLLGLPALAWSVWVGLTRQRWDALAVALMFAVSLGMWIVVNKPIQFYYHYFLPSAFLLAALALALAELKERGWKWPAFAVLGASVAVFVYFHPILSAAELPGKQSFTAWMWLEGWR